MNTLLTIIKGSPFQPVPERSPPRHMVPSLFALPAICSRYVRVARSERNFLSTNKKVNSRCAWKEHFAMKEASWHAIAHRKQINLIFMLLFLFVFFRCAPANGKKCRAIDEDRATKRPHVWERDKPSPTMLLAFRLFHPLVRFVRTRPAKKLFSCLWDLARSQCLSARLALIFEFGEKRRNKLIIKTATITIRSRRMKLIKLQAWCELISIRFCDKEKENSRIIDSRSR